MGQRLECRMIGRTGLIVPTPLYADEELVAPLVLGEHADHWQEVRRVLQRDGLPSPRPSVRHLYYVPAVPNSSVGAKASAAWKPTIQKTVRIGLVHDRAPSSSQGGQRRRRANLHGRCARDVRSGPKGEAIVTLWQAGVVDWHRGGSEQVQSGQQELCPTTSERKTMTIYTVTTPTYTMIIQNEIGIEETVASGIPLEDTLKIAIEHDSAGEAIVTCRDVGNGRLVSIGRRLSEDGAFECLAFAFMRSRFPGVVEERARRCFERKLLDNTGVFWGGRVETDEDYARRHKAGRA